MSKQQTKAVELATRWIAEGIAPSRVVEGMRCRGYYAHHCQNRNVIKIGLFAEISAC